MKRHGLFLRLCVVSPLSAACGDAPREDGTNSLSGDGLTGASTSSSDDGPATGSGGLVTTGASQGASESTDGGPSGTSSTGAVDGGESSTGSSTGAPGCEVKVYPNVAAKHPVDLMLYVDSSSSLGAELALIDANIDMHLLQNLKKYDVDYRVLVISQWPHACLPPLDCTAPAAPPTISEDGRILYVHLGTGSSGVPDGYHSFIDSYWLVPYAMGAVEPFLREGSKRVIFGLTDGEKSSNDSAGALAYEALLDERLGIGSYSVHTVAGFTPAGIVDAVLPLQGGACKGKDDSGPALKAQQLSIDTKGLRASVCGLEAGPIFDALAQSSTSSSVQCDLPIPDTLEGDVVVPENVEVDLVPGMGAAQPLQRFDEAMGCVDLGFYIEGNIVHLCPDACAAAKGDLSAFLEIRHCVAPG